MFQTYHPAESVPFRQVISLQYTQLKAKKSEINYQPEIKTQLAAFFPPFLKVILFVFDIFPGADRSKAPQSSQLLEELKQTSPSFLRFVFLGKKDVLPFKLGKPFFENHPSFCYLNEELPKI